MKIFSPASPVFRTLVRAAMVAACASIAIASRPAQRISQDFPPMEHIVIFRQKEIYSCFPTLYQRADGKMLVTRFSRRDHRSHMDPTGPGEMEMRSMDGGRSWHPVDDSGEYLPEWATGRGEQVRITDEGWIEISASERARLEAEQRRVRDVREGVVAYLSPYYLIHRSRDQGKTWEVERHRAPAHVTGLFRMYETHTTLTSSAGVRLRALYGRSSDGSGNSEIFFLRSEDDGVTWHFVRMQPNGPGEVGFDETAFVETADGRILIMLRSRPAGYLWQSYSDDQGKTWTPPEQTRMWGYPAHLLLLPDRRLLCTYGYRRAPMGIRAAVSHDHGKSWDVASEIVLRDDGKGRGIDLGYPTSALLEDGSIFTIYYMNLDDDITHIAGTRWRLP
jgi:sialidase-1